MNHNAPMRPSAFKPIGHYPHDSVIALSKPVIARPKPQQIHKEDLQRSCSRSNSARTPTLARRKSHMTPISEFNANNNNNSNSTGGALRAFFRNRTRSISPTKFQQHKNVRRMRTEKITSSSNTNTNTINTSHSNGSVGGGMGTFGGLGLGARAPGVRRMRTDTTGNIGKYDIYVPTNPKRMTSDTQLQLQLSSDRLQSIDRYRTTVSPMISSDRLHSLSSPASAAGFSPKLTVHRPSPVHVNALQPSISPSPLTVSGAGTTASGSSFGTISNPNSRNSTTTSWAPRRQLSAFDSLPTLTNSMLPLSTQNATSSNNNSNNNTPIPHINKNVKERSDRRSITVQDASIGGWIPERHNTNNAAAAMDHPASNTDNNAKPARSRSRSTPRNRFWRFGSRRASMKEETDNSWKAGYMAGLKAGRENSLTAKSIHQDMDDNDNRNIHPAAVAVFADDVRSAPTVRRNGNNNSKDSNPGKLTRMLSGNGGRNTVNNVHNTGYGNRRRNGGNSYTQAPQELRFGRRRRKRWTYGMNNNNNNNGSGNSNSNNNNYMRERSHDDMSSVTRDSDSYDER